MKFIEEKLKEYVEKVTDYGFNDEYGYYSDWADGIRPILQNFISEALDQQKLAIIEKLPTEKYSNASDRGDMISGGNDDGYNQALLEIKEIIKNI